MSRVNRTKLSPKHQAALEMFSNQVPAGAEKDPTSFSLPATAKEEPVIAEPEQEQAMPKPAEQVATDETVDIPAEQDDSDWVDNLTYDEPTAPPATQEDPEQELPSTEQEQGESDDDYIARMREEFKNLEHLDSEIADEIFDKAISPFVKYQQDKTKAEIEALRRETEELRSATSSLTQTQMQKRYDEINKPIFERHPKAKQILQSREFSEFINAQGNKYSTETNMQILSRAYEAGDTDYVNAALDSFVESRGKPKPPVNADGNGGASASTTKRSKRMTESEFLAQRRAIMANPRKYPQGALRKLEVDFFSQQ